MLRFGGARQRRACPGRCEAEMGLGRAVADRPDCGARGRTEYGVKPSGACRLTHRAFRGSVRRGFRLRREGRVFPLPQGSTGVKTICVKSRKREKQSNRLCCNKLQDIPLI